MATSFPSLEIAGLGANDAFDLAQFHLAGPETILGKRNALGCSFRGRSRGLLSAEDSKRKDDEDGEGDECFHGSK